MAHQGTKMPRKGRCFAHFSREVPAGQQILSSRAGRLKMPTKPGLVSREKHRKGSRNAKRREEKSLFCSLFQGGPNGP